MMKTEVESDEVNFPIKVYPNPFIKEVLIEFIPAQDTYVVIELYSSTGSLENLLFNDRANSNKIYKILLNNKTIGVGTHYIVFRTDKNMQLKKLIRL